MRPDEFEQRARRAGQAARTHVRANTDPLDVDTFERTLQVRRRRQQRAAALVVPVGLVVAVLLVALLPRPSTPPVIGPAPSEASPGPTSPATEGQVPTSPPLDITHELPDAPISARDGHSLVWTGSQLLVWGGTTGLEGAGDPLADGAAYDPGQRTWQQLPEAPDPGGSGHVAVWTGRRMLVAGGAREDTSHRVLAYDPATRTWSVGTEAPFAIERDTSATAWTGDRLAVWNPGVGYAEYDPASDTWTQPPAPLVPAPDDTYDRTRVLHAHGDLLYAVAAEVRAPLQVAVRRDGAWTRADELGSGTGTMPEGGQFSDARMANHTVATDAGLLAVSRSSDTIPAALLDPATGTWAELSVPGIAACEDYPTPLAIPTGAVIFNFCGQGAVFDATTRTFAPVDLPDSPAGSAQSTVWTGQALLTYATACCYGTVGTTPQMGSWEHPLPIPGPGE